MNENLMWLTILVLVLIVGAVGWFSPPDKPGRGGGCK
jgi:hypothetical protein